MELDFSSPAATPDAAPDLSVLLIGLLKGVLYRESEEREWAALLNLQARVREYAAVLNLDLVLDEAEGHAFLRSRPEPAQDDPAPRLPRLVLSRDQIVELVRVFLPDGPNEARLVDQIDSTINKVVELGFLRKLKPAAGTASAPGSYEVRRILKAFVDAQWLADFDARLAGYQAAMSRAGAGKETGDA